MIGFTHGLIIQIRVPVDPLYVVIPKTNARYREKAESSFTLLKEEVLHSIFIKIYDVSHFVVF